MHNAEKACDTTLDDDKYNWQLTTHS